MLSNENRKFLRQAIISQQSIIRRDSSQEIKEDIVLFLNVSATGCCFRSASPLKAGDQILVNLRETPPEDLHFNRARIIKSGKYYLARVVWNRSTRLQSRLPYEIGCAFLSTTESNLEHLEFFTELINHDTLEELGITKN